MRLVDQWRQIEDRLPENWVDARLVLRLDDERSAARAAGLLAPLDAGRSGSEVRFSCARRGSGARPDTVRRLLTRLDRERMSGALELVAAGEPATAEAPEEAAETARESLAASWEAQLAGLPDDWSDLYGETEFRSSDQLERAALLMSPLNPARYGSVPGFRFRCARRFGYGASPGMVRRCLERLDEEDIRGRVTILHALSDTKPVATQGPVWYIGGKAV